MYKKLLLIKIICSFFFSMAAIAGEDSSEKTIFKTVDDFVRMETRHLPGRVIIRINQPDSRQTMRPCSQLRTLMGKILGWCALPG